MNLLRPSIAVAYLLYVMLADCDGVAY